MSIPNVTRYALEELIPVGSVAAGTAKAVGHNNQRHNTPQFRSPDAILDGGRNNALTSLAASLRNKNLSEEALYAALAAENEAKCSPPLADSHIRGLVRWAMNRESSDETKAKNFPRTDAGNGERFAALCRDEVRFCPQRGHWMAWDGLRWTEDSKGREKFLAKTVARAIAKEADGLDEDAARAVRQWALRSEDQRTLLAMVKRAECEPDISIQWTDFDSDPLILNVENGILDLKTGQLRAHDREALCSRLAAVRFVPGARHPVLDAYLDHATQGDKEVEAFLQRAFGYSLTGDTSAESFFMVIGPGGAGKTTLVEALKEMLGDYASTIRSESFLKGKGGRNDGPRNDLAAMCGLRMLGASEVDEGQQLSEAVLKSLTGGEKISARFLHKEFFSFKPKAKVWMAANDAPTVSNKDTGIWRRLIKLPFMHVFSAPDPTIKEVLTNDPDARSALLSWALQGCLDWQSRGRGRDGLAVPEVIHVATKAYRESNNPLNDFIADVCDVGTDKVCPVVDMKAAYVRWCREGGTKPLAPQDFNGRLEGMGYQKNVRWLDGESKRVWVGVSVETNEPKETVF